MKVLPYQRILPTNQSTIFSEEFNSLIPSKKRNINSYSHYTQNCQSKYRQECPISLCPLDDFSHTNKRLFPENYTTKFEHKTNRYVTTSKSSFNKLMPSKRRFSFE